MTEHRTGGSRKAAPEPRSLLVRIGWVVLPLAIVSLVATLVLFGDSIFDGGSSPRQPDKGETASSQIDAETQAEVVTAATAVLQTWSRPGTDYAAWWRRLEPLLTPGGRQAYAFTDTAQLPELKDIKLEEVVAHTSGVTATIYFSTSAGRFGVDMSRRGDGAPWLANRVVFPDAESMFA